MCKLLAHFSRIWTKIVRFFESFWEAKKGDIPYCSKYGGFKPCFHLMLVCLTACFFPQLFFCVIFILCGRWCNGVSLIFLFVLFTSTYWSDLIQQPQIVHAMHSLTGSVCLFVRSLAWVHNVHILHRKANEIL